MKAKCSFWLTCALLAISNILLAQNNEEVPPPPEQSFWQTLMMIGIALMFFYVILWRPEQKRRKELENQRSALKKGDRVVAMGIIGTVVRVGDQTIIIRMFDGTKLEFVKAAISEVLPPAEEGKKIDTDEE